MKKFPCRYCGRKHLVIEDPLNGHYVECPGCGVVVTPAKGGPS